MLKFILIGSFCLYLLIYHPGWILLAGLIVGGFYILREYELKQRGERDNEPEPDLSWEYVDPEEKADREVEKMLRPGFRDDPEWQKFAKNFRDHMNRARAIEDEAMRVEGQNVKNWR